MEERLSDILKQEYSIAFERMPEEPVGVKRAAKKIRRRWPDVEDKKIESDARKLAVEMERRRDARDWEGFSWVDAMHTANAFLGSGLEKQFDKLQGLLLCQIWKGARRIYLRAMFRKYLEVFDPESTLTKKMAERLTKCWEETSLPIGRLAHHFKVFDIDDAPDQKIAKYMIEKDDSFHALRREGFEAPHGAGLMQLASRRFVSMLKSHIKDGEFVAVKKLLDWLDPDDDRSKLMGPSAGEAIDALLLPWKGREPPAAVKDLIRTRLVRAYGDLRIDPTGPWSACSEEARRVIRKWLTEVTIKVFFDIVTKVDKTHMWDDRKTLWTDFWEEGRITDAWFALSKSGESIANVLNREKNMKLAFAHNKSADSQDRKKCLLIMLFDNDYLVVEGSHNFPTWVFPPETPSKTLELRENSYTCEQIRNIREPEPERIVHHHPIEGWRNKVLIALES